MIWRTLVVLLLPTCLAASPVGYVVGHVIDVETGLPIPEVSITILGLGVGAISDSAGYYRLGPLPPGPYYVEALHIAYRRERTQAVVSGGELDVSFTLRPRVLEADEVLIRADRAVSGVTPVTFTDVPRSVLSQDYTVGDPPAFLQDEVPGLYAYSDAGSGVGYTYLKIRGFDQKRINVMINGVPLNDPEDHQVYWVDMPDLLTSTQDVQVQRGVGTALLGQYGLGGSVNLITTALPAEPGMTVRGGLGSWGTRSFSFQLTSVAAQDRSMQARFSRVISDGYRERTSSDLWSYFFAGQASKGTLDAGFAAYGGPIKTHAGWYAAHEDSLARNRRFNPAIYQNEIDSFNQPHYEVRLNWRRADGLDAGATLFYIRGRGYYEQYKEDARLRDYGIVGAADDSTLGEVIRQKWVKKDHVGWLPRVSKRIGLVEAALGGEISYFWSSHWGKLLWTDYSDSAGGDYYRYRGQKLTVSGFAHALTHLGSRVELLTDIAVQRKQYAFKQGAEGNFVGQELNRFEVGSSFVSPRVGLTFRPLDGVTTYGNVSLAQREPADAEYFDVWEGPDDLLADPLFDRADTIRGDDGTVRWLEWHGPQVDPERLRDYETGVQVSMGGITAGCALYLMQFRDEIIPYGRFDNERGAPVTGNAPRTEHRGVELEVSVPRVPLFIGQISARVNASFSDNVIKEFISHENWTEVGEDLSGNPIPLFPERLLNASLAYRIWDLEVGGRLRHVGRQYLDTSGREDRTVNSYSLAEASLRYGPFQIGRVGRVTIRVKVENLTNQEYETSGYYDAWEGARYYWVGAERTLYGGITLEM